MSADPVTMMVISSAIQIGGTYRDIQESKVQSKIEQEQYELKIKAANLDGLTKENDRLAEAEETKKNNLAVLAGSSITDDSKSFLNIQKEVDKKAQKDITTIRLNVGAQVSDYSLSAQAAYSQRKTDQFGGWVSIVNTGVETKAKVDRYKKPNKNRRYTGYGKTGYGRNPDVWQ
tara:strand:+ start:1184 stop:1705 length:522 start_codon:yes stop_codon:yes gene_type:complete